MSQRQAVSNDPMPALNGQTSIEADQRSFASTAGSGVTSNGATLGRRLSLQSRPITSSGANEESSQDESERERPKRRPKPLLRAKSDFGPRGEDHDSQTEEEIPDWGARHGFEDHYASEEYVSQLANVSCSFLSSPTLFERTYGRSQHFVYKNRFAISTISTHSFWIYMYTPQDFQIIRNGGPRDCQMFSNSTSSAPWGR